jgi:hypothetical protein
VLAHVLEGRVYITYRAVQIWEFFIFLAIIEVRAKDKMKGKGLVSNKYVLGLSALGTTVAGAFFLK